MTKHKSNLTLTGSIKKVTSIPKTNLVASWIFFQNQKRRSTVTDYRSFGDRPKKTRVKEKGKENRIVPILMDVTRSPQALRRTPMLLAVTPFPNPLTTPPVTSMYFISSPQPQGIRFSYSLQKSTNERTKPQEDQHRKKT